MTEATQNKRQKAATAPPPQKSPKKTKPLKGLGIITDYLKKVTKGMNPNRTGDLEYFARHLLWPTLKSKSFHQKDFDERMHEVGRMERIYENLVKHL